MPASPEHRSGRLHGVRGFPGGLCVPWAPGCTLLVPVDLAALHTFPCLCILPSCLPERDVAVTVSLSGAALQECAVQEVTSQWILLPLGHSGPQLPVPGMTGLCPQHLPR